jgi:outer membrane protein assembly factor BamE
MIYVIPNYRILLVYYTNSPSCLVANDWADQTGSNSNPSKKHFFLLNHIFKYYNLKLFIRFFCAIIVLLIMVSVLFMAIATGYYFDNSLQYPKLYKDGLMSRVIRLLLLAGLLINLTACISWVPYKKPNIQQGNILTQAEVNQLKPGMTKTQVTEVLGSPVIQPAFNNNQLVYVETNQINGGKITQKRLILNFKQGKLVSGEGDYQLPF